MRHARGVSTRSWSLCEGGGLGQRDVICLLAFLAGSNHIISLSPAHSADVLHHAAPAAAAGVGTRARLPHAVSGWTQDTPPPPPMNAPCKGLQASVRVRKRSTSHASDDITPLRSTLASLNRARSVIYTAALTLIKNAVRRLGTDWVDDLGMEKAFGAPSVGHVWQHALQGCMLKRTAPTVAQTVPTDPPCPGRSQP